MLRIRKPNRQLDFQLVSISSAKSNQVPSTLQSVEYKCQIINNILKTTLVQTFRSQSDQEYSETEYLFPIDENVCLESFQAQFNDKIVRGIVKDKDQAKKEYQENKSQGNFVSYAEIQKTQKEDYVKIKLGNLPPGQQVEIHLTFSQQLGSILNKYYVAYIPLQYVEDEVSAKMGKNVLTLDLFCTGRISYATSKGYPAEKIMVDENTARFNLSQALLQKDMDFQLIFSYEGMFEPQVINGSSKIYNEDSVKRALLPISQSAMVSFIPNFNSELTEEIDDTIRAAINNGDDILSDEFQQKLNQELIDHLNSSRSEFIFLLDRSGSMSGRPIQKAVEALTLFLQSLPNDSYFNVISFGSGFNKLFPQSMIYNSESLNKATTTIRNYSADLGGTEIYQPLADIFQNQVKIQGYNKQIYLLTDGEVSQPENVVNLIKKNNKFNRVHSIGFGSGADKFLIEQSAVAGKGIHKIIDLSSDLSEVIISMLLSSITPTYDEFSINYDKSIFDSTHPQTTNFPCVFKDEIINLHFFFKPLVEISSLADEQKEIKIEYYDSHLKQKVKKVIRLEMSDCFTCNADLQESVFKLGKQLYLNESIPKNTDNSLVQQAIDFQLVTEKTALICVIETLNDEQKIMFNNVEHNATYSNLKPSQLIPNIVQPFAHFTHQSAIQSQQQIHPTSCFVPQSPSPLTFPSYLNNNNCSLMSMSPPPTQQKMMLNRQSMPPPPPPQAAQSYRSAPPGCPPSLSSAQYQLPQSSAPLKDILESQSFSVALNSQSYDQLSSLPSSSISSSQQTKQSTGFFGKIASFFQSSSSPSNSNSQIQQVQPQLNQLSDEDFCDKKQQIQSQSESDEMEYDCEDDEDNYCCEKEEEQEEEEEEDNNSFACKKPAINQNLSSLQDQTIVIEQQQKQQQQQLLVKEKKEERKSKEKIKDCKSKESENITKVINPTLKLESILIKVDSQGIWSFDKNLIQQCAGLDQEVIQEFIALFNNQDVFMTLFILCILESFYSADKSKWILISKKSTSYVKKNIKEGQDFNTIKQNLIDNLIN